MGVAGGGGARQTAAVRPVIERGDDEITGHRCPQGVNALTYFAAID